MVKFVIFHVSNFFFFGTFITKKLILKKYRKLMHFENSTFPLHGIFDFSQMMCFVTHNLVTI